MADAAGAWLADDPDPATRATLERWLADGDEAALTEAFRERLQFGTAGIRGALGPGPNRMNRRLVRQVAAGLADHLGTGTVVIGRDGRHGSIEFEADVAAVLAGAGLRALVLPGPVPTPVLAFAVTHLGCAAGVMVTASHNPPADNGIKVYGGDGAQIVPPTDREISAAIDAVGSVLDLPLGEGEALDDEVLHAYLDAAVTRVPAGPRDVTLVHTAMHGVGTAPLLALFERAGFPAPHRVVPQADPDPDFSTVAFPNPEEPGALDLALARAVEVGADAVIANDPDADRLAVAVVDGGAWRPLSGDELGALLAEQALATTSGDDRLVASSIVSSTLLGNLAAEAGVTWATTLTGFKWIVRATQQRPGTRFVFGYEEALGYAVHDLVHDKDGLTAAAAFAALAARLKAEGRTVVGQLEAIARRHGLHATRQWSVRLEGAEGAAKIHEAVTRLAANPPSSIAGRAVTAVEQPADDVIVLLLEGDARVIVRPSGTEPKLKSYFQVVLAVGDDWAEAQAQANEQLDELVAGVSSVLALQD
ncbi:MAG: Glucose,6-bisphosphate synthase [Actinomycetia bacterium]|nr:Glucose,6-bisphosphate synthase [Actinomycetes bacterium]